MLDKLSELPAGSSIKKDELLKILDGMVQSEEQVLAKKEPWDFSREKSQTVFVCGDVLLRRPDAVFAYVSGSLQYRKRQQEKHFAG